MSTFTIPKPDWGDAGNIERRGEFYGFQMFTREANDTVAKVLTIVLQAGENTKADRSATILAVQGACKAVAGKFPEVHDTEPEWAITDAVNAYFDTVGFAHITREDLF